MHHGFVRYVHQIKEIGILTLPQLYYQIVKGNSRSVESNKWHNHVYETILELLTDRPENHKIAAAILGYFQKVEWRKKEFMDIVQIDDETYDRLKMQLNLYYLRWSISRRRSNDTEQNDSSGGFVGSQRRL